ncbi:HpcH/HpaI aldolase/citrate lyase family protein [Pseudalkalibacillus decolorationis]|uniref:HpcH/HpaI aldolase/citrate lyase family protein n=1 Tax=Pseudalkalibacillus decolorationis TaxID=163879 RepID=UPI0021472C1F|nr:CoA ester lyase [Pseudalkalibacillus decolorationis]
MNVCRSYLFVPAKEMSIIKKAVMSNADSVIIDLEDSVAFDQKDTARGLVKQALQELNERKQIYVRINNFTTPFWEKDLACSVINGASGVIVPKTENKEQITYICEKVRELIQAKNRTIPFKVIPLIETAKGVQFAYEIAGADPLISKLAFGSIDYSLDIGCELTSGRGELLYALSRIVVASRAADISGPIDAVFPELGNSKELELEAIQGKKLGFKGKLTIHPQQIEIVNKVFSPKEKEIEDSREIVKKFEEAERQGSASISVNGKLVDYPVYKKAKEIVNFGNLQGSKS